MSEKRSFQEWDTYYASEGIESMPWYYERLDEDVEEAIKEHGIKEARVLDLGSGPGTQAIELARRGLDVVATDISENAVRKARAAAEEAGVSVEFIADDIRESRLDGGFDLIVDRGCFHVMQIDERPVYIKKVASLLSPGGYLFLKCFSHLETMEGGPYRFTPEEIKDLFAEEFDVLSITPSEFGGTLEDNPRALFCVMQRP